MRLPYRTPFDGKGLLRFLGDRSILGVETATANSFSRTLRLAHGAGWVRLTLKDTYVLAQLWLDDLRDLTSAVARCRRLLDLDADTTSIADHLRGVAPVGALVARFAGLRSPGAVDGFEIAVRAILGQQVSVASARATAGKLATRLGASYATGDLSLTRLFPEPAAIAAASPSELGLPMRRAHTLVALAESVYGGLTLDPGVDREQTYADLVRIPGIGSWTARYIVMRALSDTDVLLTEDLHVRRQLGSLAPAVDPAEMIKLVGPWGSYVTHALWRNA